MDDGALQMLVDVGALARAGAGHRAGGHVAHGVRTGFACRQVGLSQPVHRHRRLRQRDEVDLYRLARRDVRGRMLGILGGHVADRIELVGVERAAGRLDADHVDAGLALSIAAHLQAHRSEAVIGNLAPRMRFDRFGVAIDFQRIGQRRFENESSRFGKRVHATGPKVSTEGTRQRSHRAAETVRRYRSACMN